jgi:pimeloyl-ACP methyl ester carboxylesterase
MKPVRAIIASVLILVVSCTTSNPPSAVSSDGSQIAYELHGDHGPTLILVHGWTNNRTFWDPHISTLSQDFRVAAMDLAGFGESDRERASWTMERFGEDVTAVIDALGIESVVLVGFSMGGAAVLEAASANPERVAGVVIVDVFHDVNQKYSEVGVNGFVAQEKELWHDREYLRGDFSPDAPESLIQRYIDKTPPVPPEYWFEIIRDYFAWRNDDLVSTIEKVTAPVAAINGEYRNTDVAAFRTHAPTFEMKTIPGVGHLGVIWMETDLFDQHLRELAESMVGEE